MEDSAEKPEVAAVLEAEHDPGNVNPSPSPEVHQKDAVDGEISSKIRDAVMSQMESLLQKELIRIQSQLSSAFETHLEAVKSELKTSVEAALEHAEKAAQTKLESKIEEVKSAAKTELSAEISHHLGLNVVDRAPQSLRDFVNAELSQVKADVRAEIQAKLSQAEQHVFDEIKTRFTTGTEHLRQELTKKIGDTRDELKSHIKTVLFNHGELSDVDEKMADFESRIEQRLLQVEVGFETGFIDLKKNAKMKIQKFEERIKDETRGHLAKWLALTVGIVLLCTVGTIINVIIGHHGATNS